MTPPVYITDIIGEVVTAVETKVLSLIKANETAALEATKIEGIRYSKSSFDELIETLAQADQSPEEKYKKFPLIHLVRDIKEKRGRLSGIYAEENLNIIFIHQTVNTYKIDDRDEKVFKPVLWPMYREFMKQLVKNKWINNADEEMIQHDVTARAYWGTRQLQTVTKNKLNDYVDAIEIENLQIKINFSNC